MKTKVKEVYYCAYCKKYGLSKHAMNRHESICIKNPEYERPCFDCKNLTKKKIEIFSDGYHGDQSRIVNLLYCSKKEQYLHTPKNQIKRNAFDLDDHSNDPMPKECDLFEKHEYLDFSADF